MLIATNFIVMIVGLLMFILSKINADLKEIGRVLFFCGLFVILLTGNKIVALLTH